MYAIREVGFTLHAPVVKIVRKTLDDPHEAVGGEGVPQGELA